MKNFLICLCLFLTGCKGYQYVSPPNYVPVNLERGNITWNMSLNYFQAGYAFTNHLSLYTGGFYRSNKGGTIKSTDLSLENEGAYVQTDSHRHIEAGITWFSNINEFSSFEIVAGTGLGKMKYTNTLDLDRDYTFSFDSRTRNYFIQPNLTVRSQKYIDFTFFSRLNQVEYYDVNKSFDPGSNSGPEDYDKFLTGRGPYSMMFLEPGFQLQVGAENFKLQMMGSGIYDMDETGMQFRKFNYYMGVSVKINLTKKKQ